MDLKKLFRIYDEDPSKYGLYDLSVRFYSDIKDGIPSFVFVTVRLGHLYDTDPVIKRNQDFMELLTNLQDCIGLICMSATTSNESICIEGWL